MQNELSSRLITLSDGRQGLRGTLHVEIHVPSDPGLEPRRGKISQTRESEASSAALGSSRHNMQPSLPVRLGPGSGKGEGPGPSSQSGSQPILEFVSSDETLDRYDEIIAASGWKLTNYQRNPVFQNNHQAGDIIHTLGKALSTEVRGGKLFQRIQFATDVNPMARIAFGLYQGKFLNAVSVGFVPLRWENGTDKTAYRRKFLEQELLEVSAVGIPANPNALAMAYKSGAVEKSDLRETFDLLRLTLETPASREQRLLSVIKQLHQLIHS
jgi:HK97 family phage prohead protease